MVYYKLIKVTINALGLAEVIIDMIVRYYGLLDSIITDWELIFTSKFWSSLCYYLGIKHRLSNTFHPQTYGQTERPNSTIKAYLWAFVNFKQDDWAWFFLMTEFAYNNAKNASTGHMPFKLNCGYYSCVFSEKDIDPRSKLKSAKELSSKL